MPDHLVTVSSTFLVNDFTLKKILFKVFYLNIFLSNSDIKLHSFYWQIKKNQKNTKYFTHFVLNLLLN